VGSGHIKNEQTTLYWRFNKDVLKKKKRCFLKEVYKNSWNGINNVPIYTHSSRFIFKFHCKQKLNIKGTPTFGLLNKLMVCFMQIHYFFHNRQTYHNLVFLFFSTCFKTYQNIACSLKRNTPLARIVILISMYLTFVHMISVISISSVYLTAFSSITIFATPVQPS